jgi:oligoendopeptidase F
MLGNKLFGYLSRLGDLNLADQKVKAKMADAERRYNQAAGQYLEFFSLELAKLSQAAIDRQKTDPVVRKHLPMIASIRRDRPHMLSEPVESALTKRSMYGAGSWAEFYEEIEADLRFALGEQNLTLEEILHVLSEDPDPETRAKALRSLNEGFRGYFAKYAAQTLNMISGAKAVEDAERHYAHPMAARNEGNAVDDRVVDALHQAVKDTGGPLARRYYRLKASILGLPKMRWSDRNAKLPFDLKEGVPFDEAMGTVTSAYQSFSPELAKLIRQMRADHLIDAPVVPGKASGAYCSTLILPGNKPVPLVLLNYQGSQRDVMTLAHELGHAVHGILGGQAQGALMAHAPMAYAETASVFGEMTTFNYLRAELEKSGDKRALLALLTSKIDDIINTSVRQISFSNFERRVHGAKRRLSVEELNKIWLEVTQEMYGQEGEVFTYADMEYLWAYISHFHRPFYVYSYAFGELLTHSLYAQQARLGKKFEPRYLELLRAGGTKNAVELLKPFGLDPRDPDFWSAGIRLSLGSMIDEAERLARELGYQP